MPLYHKPPKVITCKGVKKILCRTSGNKSQITILACANAAGTTIPPMVIFFGQSSGHEAPGCDEQNDAVNRITL